MPHTIVWNVYDRRMRGRIAKRVRVVAAGDAVGVEAEVAVGVVVVVGVLPPLRLRPPIHAVAVGVAVLAVAAVAAVEAVEAVAVDAVDAVLPNANVIKPLYFLSPSID